MFQNGVVLLEKLELPSKSTTAYCRLCLAQNELVELNPTAENRLNLGDDVNANGKIIVTTATLAAQQLIELIFECTDVRISLNAGESNCAVCKGCNQALLDFHRFRSQAKRIDELIKSKLEEQDESSSENTEETTNDDDDDETETDKTDEPQVEQQQSIQLTEQPQETPIASSVLPRKRPLLLGCDVLRQSSGGFLAIGVKRPRPKLPITPAIIIAATTKNANGDAGKHKCRYCPKSFKTPSGLAEHARVHNRPHQCPNCLEQFQHAPSLARHIRNRTCFTFTKYRCRVCTESFLEKADWAEHIKIHASDFPYQCQQCLSQFKHKATLRRHVNTVHLLQY